MKTCESCGQEGPTTKHHLIPKEWARKQPCKKILGRHARVHLCPDCHRKIHRSYSNEELARLGWSLFPDSTSRHWTRLKYLQGLSGSSHDLPPAPVPEGLPEVP